MIGFLKSSKKTIAQDNVATEANMKHYIGIAGTHAKGSTNTKLINFIQKHLAGKAEVELVDVTNWPVFHKTENFALPAGVKEVADKIAAADGVIIATPEYDHSIPASLMNGFAWLSYGIHPFDNKPVMITGASYGALGTSRAQAHIRRILDAPEIHARTLSSSDFMVSRSLGAFDDEGNLTDAALVKRFDALFAEFEVLVEVVATLAEASRVAEADAEKLAHEG
ncbi:MAG: NAD(P)H-dependent oxidoreductase [Limosilactobacillus sp.]|nr:NAD(P)H-dependent oxidoreductase [Limosilactobacillus sp.]